MDVSGREFLIHDQKSKLKCLAYFCRKEKLFHIAVKKTKQNKTKVHNDPLNGTRERLNDISVLCSAVFSRA